MIIESKIKNYKVMFKDDFHFISEFDNLENVQFVIDKNVYDIYNELFSDFQKDRVIITEALERNKTIDTVLEICERMTSISAKRNSHIISIGGGIIQDITGFVANVLYRGIKWTFVPTTLLAACDSCIGGKTSLNYKGYKNLLGTFFPPDNIFICCKFFKTLTDKDYKSGLGEVVKFNIMAGDSRLEYINRNINKLLNREENTICEFIKSSLEYKKQFIEIDEFDKGERIKLNYAHTFGHTIEVASNYEIPHGTAVAIGMIMADSISVKRKLLDESKERKSREILKKIISIDMSKVFLYGIDNFIKTMQKDKKQIDEGLTAVLRTETGLELVHDICRNEVKYAMEQIKSLNKDN